MITSGVEAGDLHQLRPRVGDGSHQRKAARHVQPVERCKLYQLSQQRRSDQLGRNMIGAARHDAMSGRGQPVAFKMCLRKLQQRSEDERKRLRRFSQSIAFSNDGTGSITSNQMWRCIEALDLAAHRGRQLLGVVEDRKFQARRTCI